MLDGVGEKTELRLWDHGILTWEDFLRAPSVSCLSKRRKSFYDEYITDAIAKLQERDTRYFKEHLNSTDQWRLYEEFRDQCVYLDIETNGFPADRGGRATVIGLYDGVEFSYLMRGRDLSADNLMEALAPYKMLVTFYGSVFDVPFLESTLRGFKLNIPHFDLCFGAKRLGMQGGLKKLEERFGIIREEATQGMAGYDAVLLWKLAKKGDKEAMDLLIAYNREDTVNLRYIADTIYKGLKESTGIAEYVSNERA